MGATENDMEKYGPLDKYPTCVCPLCDRTEQTCCCSRDDVFKAASIAWQRDYDEILQLRAELKAEREALREACESVINAANRVCGYCEPMTSECKNCYEKLSRDTAHAHLKRLENLNNEGV